MQAANNTVVTINYMLTDDQGNILDRSTENGFAYLHGAHDIIPGLENALTGRSAGAELKLSIPPEEAYGTRDEKLTQVVALDAFDSPEKVEPGQQFHAQSESGKPIVITVAAVNSNEITIDCNHPLAGETLNFDLTILDVRPATEEEIAHGHAHDANHTHHH